MSSVYFEPAELADLRNVFEEITSQPWFSRDADARKAFAKYVLNTYPGGIFNPVTDKPSLEAAAKTHFSRD